MRPVPVSTFSIVAADVERGEWGIAVQSRFVAVGAVVPWASPGAGAIATQAWANPAYGPDGLALLKDGKTAAEVVTALTNRDPKSDVRQLGVVDRFGGSAAFTGRSCHEWAGHEIGEGFACQGNILLGASVVRSMARAYESTPGDLPERLLASLSAGQREGGDRRGMQSAALLVVRAGAGYGGTDRWIDVRVDDHASPIEELRRVFKIYDLTLLEREDPASRVPIDAEIARVVQHHLHVLGYYSGRLTASWDAPTQAAFSKFLHENNFEGKERSDGTIWPSVLDYLQQKAAAEVARRSTTAPIQTGALSRGPGAAPSRGEKRSPKPSGPKDSA